MSNILYDLFLERYHPRDVAWDTEESDALFNELDGLERAISKLMGRENREMLFRYTQIQEELRDLAYAAYFTEGFRLYAGLCRAGCARGPARPGARTGRGRCGRWGSPRRRRRGWCR